MHAGARTLTHQDVHDIGERAAVVLVASLLAACTADRTAEIPAALATAQSAARQGDVVRALGIVDSRLAQLSQDGWEVSYTRYAEQDGYWLPERLRLEGHDIQVTLVIKDWQPRHLGQ